MPDDEVYVSEVASLYPPQGRWREADYFALPEAKRIVELTDGCLSIPPAPTPLHQRIAMALAFELEQYVLQQELGQVLMAPTPVRLWTDQIREPDVLFMRRENLYRIGDDLVDGPPDWVAEVISPATRKIDEKQKMSVYARAHIEEYWLVDPEKGQIRTYLLVDDKYRKTGTFRPGETARAMAISNFSIAVADVLTS